MSFAKTSMAIMACAAGLAAPAAQAAVPHTTCAVFVPLPSPSSGILPGGSVSAGSTSLLVPRNSRHYHYLRDRDQEQTAIAYHPADFNPELFAADEYHVLRQRLFWHYGEPSSSRRRGSSRQTILTLEKYNYTARSGETVTAETLTESRRPTRFFSASVGGDMDSFNSFAHDFHVELDCGIQWY